MQGLSIDNLLALERSFSELDVLDSLALRASNCFRWLKISSLMAIAKGLNQSDSSCGMMLGCCQETR